MGKRVVLFVQGHTNLMDLGGVAQVFHEARAHGLDLDIIHCGARTSTVSSIGPTIGGLLHYQDVEPGGGDQLFVLSADIEHVLSQRPDKKVSAWLQRAHANGATLCGICNGVFLLGRAGLLDGRKCTTHWKRTTQLQRANPRAQVIDDVLFVAEPDLITSAGATSGVDVALHVLARLRDEHFAHVIARELIIYKRRSGPEAQQSIYLVGRNHLHTGIHRVQDWLQANLHRSTTVSELAGLAHMSSRNFARVFRRETSLSVWGYVTLLRKERIRELLKQPDLSRKQIAQRCGLTSERQINRIIT